MKAWGYVFWLSLGGLLEGQIGGAHRGVWLLVGAVSALGWAWSALAAGDLSLVRQFSAVATGRPVPLARTDPKAMAEELAALNAQIAQLRDTATSFDVSFDQTLHRLDERLRRVEQQSSYIHINPGT